MITPLLLIFLIISNQCYENNNTFLRHLQGSSSSSTNSYDYSDYSAEKTVSSTEIISSDISTTTAGASALYVTSTGEATVGTYTITKSGDYTDDIETCEFYGVNAAVLVNGGNATFSGTTINTSAKGANAVFATNSGTITISNSVITSTGSSSARGLDATYGGKITGTNVSITTDNGSCATLATDRGEGTVSCSQCTLVTNGAGSPVIYSTGDISISNTIGTANAAQMVVVEGKNSATVSSSTLKCAGNGNRDSGADKCGVMIYQSMSGDADDGIGSFTASDSTMEILSTSSVYSSAPMFFVTNTEATITLSNVTFSYGSNIFIDIEGTSEWGTEGSNGGDVTMTVTGQTIVGDIVVDDYSSLTLYLNNSSSFKGTINSAQSSGTIEIIIDSTSTLTLTGESYITTLTNSDSENSNIDGDYTLNIGTNSNSSNTNDGSNFLKRSLICLILN